MIRSGSRADHGPDEPDHLDVPVITEPRVVVRDGDLARLERDALVLTAEERRWGRRRVTTRGGRTLALALRTGIGLVPGDVLHVGMDWYVVIEAAPEPVLAVTPRTRDEMVRVAFEVGNRHFTLALDGDRLLLPDDPAMDQLLTRLGVAFERERVPFMPVGAGPRHDHDHGH
jgi:urease accessory protein